VAEHQLNITTGGKPLSDEAKKRVTESLKKALQEELAKEHHTLGGNEATAAEGVGGHANITRSDAALRR
jgi:hypothetical protein